MGMGQSFLSGMYGGYRRSPIHHLDISPYITASKRAPAAPPRQRANPSQPFGASMTQRFAEEERQRVEQERYREKMDLEKDKWATEEAQKQQELEAKKQEALIKRQESIKEMEMKDLKLRKMEQELGLTSKAAAQQAEQQRRINGWNQALVGLQFRDPDLISAGMKNMIPGGFQRIAESKTADGTRKFSTSQVVPDFSFGADGNVTVKFPSGEAAMADPQTVAKMVLYPLWPGAEKPANAKAEGNSFDKEEHKSLLEERQSLQKAVTTGVDADGGRIPDDKVTAAQARIAEIDKRIKAISGEGDGKGLQFGDREKMGGEEAPKGKPLDTETAKSILKEAGGDKDKARQMARERGFDLAATKPATGPEPPPTAGRETVKKMNAAVAEDGKRTFAVDPKTGKPKEKEIAASSNAPGETSGSDGKGASGEGGGGGGGGDADGKDSDSDKKKKKKKKNSGD